MFRIKAVVGRSVIKNFELWEISQAKSKTIFLDEHTSFADIGAIFARMAHELKIAHCANVETALETIINHGKFPEGAIHFIGNDDEKDERVISTGCCFGGVRAWQELFDIPKPEKSVWLGHSPTPEIEHLPSGLIRIWANGERKESKNFFFESTRKDFKAKILQLERDLEQILVKCYTYPQCFTQFFASAGVIVRSAALTASESAS